jgi:hypothetical protein
MARFIQSWNFMRAHPSLGKRMKAFSQGKRVAELARSPSIRAALRPRKLLHNNGIDAFEVVRDATAATWEGDREEVQTLMWIDIGENKLKLPDCTPEKARNILKSTGDAEAPHRRSALRRYSRRLGRPALIFAACRPQRIKGEAVAHRLVDLLAVPRSSGGRAMTALWISDEIVR